MQRIQSDSVLQDKEKIKDIKDLDLLQRLLLLRGIYPTEKDYFLNPDYETGLHDPFLLKNMDKVVERILKAICAEEHILVYSDYDADGLPGAAVLNDFFRTISYPNVSFFRPDRHVEGFGIHSHVLDEFIGAGIDKPATLIITIDCGITDYKPTKELKNKFSEAHPELSLDIIITDHHLPGEELPDVFAIINPKLPGDEYPEKMLCGAAVIFKVVCALIQKGKGERFENIPIGYEKWLLDLVGMATLSDMVPLRGENRLLAYYGLIVLKKTRRPGLIALAKTNNLDMRNIVEDDVVFTFSPRINVASRLADAKIAFDLLTATEFDEAMRLAKELNSINQKRKTMVAQISKQAHATVKARELFKKPIMTIGNPDWRPPVLGLVATQMVKTYSRPTFVWGRTAEGEYKGSCRSVEGIDIVEIMRAAPEEIFINRGGHAQSGGFSVQAHAIHEFDSHLETAFFSLDKNKNESGHIAEMPQIVYEVDAEVPLSHIRHDTFDLISKMAPFGMDNQKPLFVFKNCQILKANMFGKEKDHLELVCRDESLGEFRTIKAIQFFYEGNSDDLQKLNSGLKISLIGHIEKNQFRGANEMRIRIVDLIY